MNWLYERRGYFYGVLLILFATVVVTEVRDLREIDKDLQKIRHDLQHDGSMRMWVAEYFQVRMQLAAFVSGHGDHDGLVQRFDILWSRVETVLVSDIFPVARKVLGIKRVANDLAAALALIEDDVLGLQPQDWEKLAKIEHVLIPFEQKLIKLNVDTAAIRQEKNYALQDKVVEIISKITVIALSIGALSLALLTLFASEAWFARRAELDVRKRKEQLRIRAYQDSLTGLANRAAMQERIEAEIEALAADTDVLALLVVDLDGFKLVNDTFGHETGDQLLCRIAERLRHEIRACDLVARFGGDEFVILLSSMRDRKVASEIAERLITVIEQPVALAEQTVHVSGSIGYAFLPGDAADAHDLHRLADTALYVAKAAGRGQACQYRPCMGDNVRRRKTIDHRLRAALAGDGLSLIYQPKVRTIDAVPVAAEALLRWHDDDLGQISPQELVSVAEDTGLIMQLDRYVLDRVIREASTWTGAAASLQVAANLSPALFRADDLVAFLRHKLDEYGLPPQRLQIEITEGALMVDTDGTIGKLASLRELGIELAIDDFGVGYSSLGYLKRFAIDQIKIDRSFVMDLESDADDRAIVRGILGLASSLGLDTVAEGVETAEQWLFLRELGCTQCQGYYFSRPLAQAELLDFVEPAINGRACVGLPAAIPSLEEILGPRTILDGGKPPRVTSSWT